MFRLFRSESKDTGLPLDLVAAIEGAHFMLRASDPEQGSRVLVVLVNGGSWIADDEENRTRIKRYWPELSEGQTRRAESFLKSRIAKHLRELASGRPASPRKNWVNSWRYPDETPETH